jgi:O-antigen/teichoic acid export membrane protein
MRSIVRYNMPMSGVKNLAVAVLRWSERYTKTDMVYLASGGFWLVLGQFGAALTSFVFSLVVARYLDPNVYGSYRYILSLVTIIGAVSLTGLGTTIIRDTAQGIYSSLRSGYWLNLRWSFPMLIGFVGIATYYSFKGAHELAIGIGIAGIATAFINSAALFNAYWSGKKDFLRQTLYWSVANITTVGATIAAIFLSNDLVIIVATYFIASALANGTLYLLTSSHFPGNVGKRMDKDALHLSILNFLNTVSGNIDKIIVYQLLGTAQLAVYTFALAIPEQLRAVLKAGARLALPRFAERSLDEIRSTIVSRILRFSIFIMIAAVCYIILAPYVFPILFPKYVASIPYSKLLVLTLFTVLGAAPLAALQAHAKLPALYTHSILTNIIQISCSIGFISLWGLWGAVTAVVVNRTVQLILPLYLLTRDSRQHGQ